MLFFSCSVLIKDTNNHILCIFHHFSPSCRIKKCLYLFFVFTWHGFHKSDRLVWAAHRLADIEMLLIGWSIEKEYLCVGFCRGRSMHVHVRIRTYGWRFTDGQRMFQDGQFFSTVLKSLYRHTNFAIFTKQTHKPLFTNAEPFHTWTILLQPI